VINHSDIAAASGNKVNAGAYYLGRPWREYARVVVQDTKISNVINSAGWATWNKGDNRTSSVYFGEFGNSGSGAGAKRVGFAKQLGQAVSMETVLGPTKWMDKKWVP
jgi:pectinesterase